MKIFRSSALLAALVFTGSLLTAQDLKLIPEPRELQRKPGAFALGASTHIVLGAGHFREDRLAADTIADDIKNLTGRKVSITIGTMPAGTGAIYLARTSDDRTLNTRLKASKLAIDDTFDEEGYVLEAGPSRIIIAAHTGAGLFYGAQTLRQLLLPSSDGKHLSAPAVAIRDWPAMRWRGVHDDLSRGPVPTLDYMKKQVRTLAEYKINLFSLYMEHIFDYQSQPLIAPQEGSLNAAQVKELTDYAQRYHVTILPEQQAFGHLHHVLQYEIYSDLAETPHGHVLTPTKPGSYDLIKSLIRNSRPSSPDRSSTSVPTRPSNSARDKPSSAAPKSASAAFTSNISRKFSRS
jgi:hexosaminidase